MTVNKKNKDDFAGQIIVGWSQLYTELWNQSSLLNFATRPQQGQTAHCCLGQGEDEGSRDANAADPLASMLLQPQDYGLFTEYCLKLTRRIVFGLEGGYDLSALSQSVVETIERCLQELGLEAVRN